MALLESGTYIDNSLNSVNPVATDGLAQADDHMRLIKSTILASFPSITGAVNATHTISIRQTAIPGVQLPTKMLFVDADRVPVNKHDGTWCIRSHRHRKTYMNSNITTINGLTINSSMEPMVTPGNDSTNGSGTLSFQDASAFVSGMLMPYGRHLRTQQGGCFVMDRQSAGRPMPFVYSRSHTYGTGDGSTTFNLPDLRGRVHCR